MATDIISREDAVCLGQSWYFTGKACKHGHIDRRRVDNSACMQCERDKATRLRNQFPELTKTRTKAWRERNSEHLKEYNKKNRDRWNARPGNVERHRQAARDFYEANRERQLVLRKAHYDKNKNGSIAEYLNKSSKRRALWKRAYREANREAIAAYNAEWRRNNPDKRSLNERKRKSRKIINGGSHTWADIEALLLKQSALCAACATSIENKFHIDHKLPLSRGGSNGPENLQLLCQPCNSHKHAKTMDEWRSMNGG